MEMMWKPPQSAMGIPWKPPQCTLEMPWKPLQSALASGAHMDTPLTRRLRSISAFAAVVALGIVALVIVPPAWAQAPAPAPAASGGDERTRVFAAPPERVFTVARSTLLSLGWKVDKEDRDVGWVLTKSRGVNLEDYGVYAKGTKHRLRVVVKGRDGRSEVTVERRVWKEERILFVDKEEDIPTSDRTVERGLLDAIARSL
jgi:hypothetical protein